MTIFVASSPYPTIHNAHKTLNKNGRCSASKHQRFQVITYRPQIALHAGTSGIKLCYVWVLWPCGDRKSPDTPQTRWPPPVRSPGAPVVRQSLSSWSLSRRSGVWEPWRSKLPKIDPVQVCVYVYIYIHTYVHICMCIYVCMCVYIYIYCGQM